MTSNSIKAEIIQVSDGKEQICKQEFKDIKGRVGLLNIIKLRLWYLINKFPLRNLFRQYSGKCNSCGSKYSETAVNYYLKKEISCNKCKFRVKILSKPVSIILDLACKTLNMPRGEFKRILRDNISYKRVFLSILEGVGTFGFQIPIIPIGPFVIPWSITNRCNLDCIHCYVQKNTNSEELTFEQACSTIDQISAVKNMILGFSGGEPLLREDIFDLIQYAFNKHMNVALATNGTLINEEVAYQLKNSGLEYVLISLDGLEDVHDKIRGKGMFQKAIRGIQNCVNEGLYVCINFVATKLNFHQIYELVELAKELNVRKFEVIDFVQAEKAYNLDIFTLNPLEIEKLGIILTDIWHKLIIEKDSLMVSWKNPIFSRIIAERYPKAKILPMLKGCFPSEITRLFNFSECLSRGILKKYNPFSAHQTGCEAGYFILHIRPNGDLSPCPLHPYPLGNVKRDNIQEIWMKSPVLNQFRKMKFEGSCNKCVFKVICGGGCRSKVYLKTGSHINSDYSCILNINR